MLSLSVICGSLNSLTKVSYSMKIQILSLVLLLCLGMACVSGQSAIQTDVLGADSSAAYEQRTGPMTIEVYCNIMDPNCQELYLALSQSLETFPPNTFNVVWKNNMRDGFQYWDLIGMKFESCFNNHFNADEFVFFVKRFYKRMSPYSRDAYARLARRSGEIGKIVNEAWDVGRTIMTEMKCDMDLYDRCIKSHLAPYIVLRVREVMDRGLSQNGYHLIVGKTTLTMNVNNLLSVHKIILLLRQEMEKQNQ
jgi:hypothetical protein